MSDTQDEPTEGPVKISWASRSKMCHIVCAPPSEDGLPHNHIVDVIPPGEGFQGSRDEMDANAELVKAAFSAAHELPDDVDFVAAVEQLPKLLRIVQQLENWQSRNGAKPTLADIHDVLDAARGD